MLPIGGPSRLKVTTGASRDLLGCSIRQREYPNVHISGSVRIERDLQTISRPRTAAVFTCCGNDILRCASRFTGRGRNRQPPKIGVLLQHRKAQTLSVRRERELNVLPGACCYLLRLPGRFAHLRDAGPPNVVTAAAVG